MRMRNWGALIGVAIAVNGTMNTPLAWGQDAASDQTPALEESAPAADTNNAPAVKAPEPEPAPAVEGEQTPPPHVEATEAAPSENPRVTPASPEAIERWKRKWMWTGIGGGTALLLSFMEGNAVKSANSEQTQHIQTIESNPLMSQGEYNSHKAAILSAESKAKQAKTLADLFFLTSTGLIGTATYFYFHPPRGDDVAAQLFLLPVSGGYGLAFHYQLRW